MKKYSMVPGRFQCRPLHKGHLALIRSLLGEGKLVLIALRDTPKSETDPYSLDERAAAFHEAFGPEIEQGRLRIIYIPDIEEVCYGRKVGWGIREIQLDAATEAISATAIRKDPQSGILHNR